MGKLTICLGENKGADQLRGHREADQRLCFRFSDSTIPLLLKSEISSFQLFSVLVQVGLCRTCLETTLLVFPRGGSFVIIVSLFITDYQIQHHFICCCLKNRHDSHDCLEVNKIEAWLGGGGGGGGVPKSLTSYQAK